MKGHSGDTIAFAFLTVSGIAGAIVADSLRIRYELLFITSSLAVAALGLVLLIMAVWRNYR